MLCLLRQREWDFIEISFGLNEEVINSPSFGRELIIPRASRAGICLSISLRSELRGFYCFWIVFGFLAYVVNG